MLTPYARAKFRVKIKSLAEEVRIIKHEVSRHKGKWSNISSVLVSHLHMTVKPEIRWTLAAYAYLRGKPFAACENTSHSLQSPYPKQIARIIKSLAGIHVEPMAIYHWLNADRIVKRVAEFADTLIERMQEDTVA